MEPVERYPQHESRTGHAVTLLVAYKWPICAVLALLTVGWTFWGWKVTTPGVPRWLRLFVLTGVVMVPATWPLAKRLVNWLHQLAYTYGVDVEYVNGTVELEVWEFPPAVLKDLEVRDDGTLPRLEAAQPAIEINDYDPEENTTDGVWRGSAGDLELLTHQQKVDEIRGDLEAMAKEGLSLRVQLSSLVRSASKSVVGHFIESMEPAITPNGEAIQQAVDAALEEQGIDRDALDDDGTESGGGDDQEDVDDVDQEPSAELGSEITVEPGPGPAAADGGTDE